MKAPAHSGQIQHYESSVKNVQRIWVLKSATVVIQRAVLFSTQPLKNPAHTACLTTKSRQMIWATSWLKKWTTENQWARYFSQELEGTTQKNQNLQVSPSVLESQTKIHSHSGTNFISFRHTMSLFLFLHCYICICHFPWSERCPVYRLSFTWDNAPTPRPETSRLNQNSADTVTNKRVYGPISDWVAFIWNNFVF